MRWYILALFLFTNFFIAGAGRSCLLVLFRAISVDLDLSLVAIGTVWGMDSFAGFIICLPGGLLLDRLGIKKTAVLVCLLAGISGPLRGLSSSFPTLAIAVFTYGLIAAMTIGLGPKIVSYYFQGKNIGLMNAFIFFSMMLGQMTGAMFSATYLSSLLGGWRNVMFFYGIPAIIIGLLWLTSKSIEEKETGEATEKVPESLLDTLREVACIKYLWVLGVVCFAHMGSFLSINSYLPLYLSDIGWSSINADGALTLVIGAISFGMLPIVFFSDKLKNRKLFLFWIMLLMSLILCLLFFTRYSVFILLIIIINGILRGAPAPLVSTLALESPGVKTEFVGTSIGLVTTIGMVGGFILPPIGNSFAVFNPALPFVFWGLLTIALASVLFLLKTKPYPIPG